MKQNKTIQEINEVISNFHFLEAKRCLHFSEISDEPIHCYKKNIIHHATMAADNGSLPAQSLLGMLYMEGSYANKSIFLAQKYYKMAADAGCHESQYLLAKLYLESEGSPYTNKLSLGYIMDSAASGYLPAIKLLSRSYQYGDYGLEVDFEKAISGFKIVSEIGDREDIGIAFNAMGLIYSSVDGPHKYDLAFLYFSKAAMLGLINAKYNIGTLYQNGEGCNINQPMAYKFFREAAMVGHRDSMYNLAVMYKEGLGVKQSISNCIYWLRKGTDSGDFAAKTALELLMLSRKGRSNGEEVKYYDKGVENQNNLIYIKDYINN